MCVVDISGAGWRLSVLSWPPNMSAERPAPKFYCSFYFHDITGLGWTLVRLRSICATTIPIPTSIWIKAHQIPIVPLVPMMVSEIGRRARISLRKSKKRMASRMRMPLKTNNNPIRSNMEIFFFGGFGGLSRFFWTSWKGGAIFSSSWFTLPVMDRSYR